MIRLAMSWAFPVMGIELVCMAVAENMECLHAGVCGLGKNRCGARSDLTLQHVTRLGSRGCRLLPPRAHSGFD